MGIVWVQECTSISNLGVQLVLNQLKWTILDHFETTLENLTKVGHQGGPQCRCSECQRLKTVEDKWICRMGSFYGDSGLNTRDEVKSRSRVNFVGQK